MQHAMHQRAKSSGRRAPDMSGASCASMVPAWCSIRIRYKTCGNKVWLERCLKERLLASDDSKLRSHKVAADGRLANQGRRRAGRTHRGPCRILPRPALQDTTQTSGTTRGNRLSDAIPRKCAPLAQRRRPQAGYTPIARLPGMSSLSATWAAPCRLDRGDLDLLHSHHRVERALGSRLITTGDRF